MPKTKRKARLLTREKLAIVREAIRLIRNPKHWTTGKWKKQVDTKRDGTPVYAYCVDGAVNQATVNVLGLLRAIALGAALPDKHDPEGYRVDADDGEVCDRLSVRKLAFEVLRGKYPTGADSELAEDNGDAYQISLNDDRLLGHKAVMQVLRKKERQLRAAVETLDAKKAT